MRCQDFEEIANSYADGELPVEATQAASLHVNECCDCRAELARLQMLNRRISTAVKEASGNQINHLFIEKLRSKAREMAQPPLRSRQKLWREISFKQAFAAGTLALLLITGSFTIVRLHALNNFGGLMARQNSDSVSPPGNSNLKPEISSGGETLPATKIAWREMMHDAAGEHENCTLKNLQIEHSPAGNNAQSPIPDGSGLAEIVRESLQKNIADRIELTESHLCESGGRKYTHLIFRRGKSLISVMVTDSENLNGSDEAMFCETANNYQVACFNARRHTVFVISDLPEPDNLKLARSISPPIRQYLAQTKNSL